MDIICKILQHTRIFKNMTKKLKAPIKILLLITLYDKIGNKKCT